MIHQRKAKDDNYFSVTLQKLLQKALFIIYCLLRLNRAQQTKFKSWENNDTPRKNIYYASRSNFY